MIYRTNMWGEQSNLLCRQILHNLCGYSDFRKRENNFSALECGPHVVTSCQRAAWEGWGRVTFTVDKPDDHSLGQAVKVNVNTHGSCARHPPLIQCDEKAASVDLKPKTHNPGKIMRKTPDTFQSRDSV